MKVLSTVSPVSLFLRRSRLYYGVRCIVRNVQNTKSYLFSTMSPRSFYVVEMYHNHMYTFYPIVLCTAIPQFMTSLNDDGSGKSPCSFVVVRPLCSFVRLLRQHATANEWRMEQRRRTTRTSRWCPRSFVWLNDNVIPCVVQVVLSLLPSFFASFVPFTERLCLYRVANVCSTRKGDRLRGRIRRSPTTSPPKETTTTCKSLSNSHVHACCVLALVRVTFTSRCTSDDDVVCRCVLFPTTVRL